MAMQNGFSSSGVLWERAKELLKKDDYERLKIALKTFSKTRSVEGLCSDLLKIVNSRSKVDILTEVRRCLPKNQRNNFTRHCNELLETEAERERGDLEKKRKIEAKGILERENSAPNFQGSPAKKTRQDREKPLSSRTEKIASQRTNKLASDCSKEPANQARKIGAPGTLSSQGEFEHKIVELVIERKALNQGFGLRIRGGTFHQPSITVAQVAKDSLADRQGLKAGDRIVRVNDKRCGRGGVDIAQVIGIIKGSGTLRMRVVSADVVSKDDCKVQDVAEAKGSKPDGKIEEKRLSTVCVYPDEDGWLGCCIRGGTDYACDVHVISVDSCSPAERAGVKAGDVIVEVNGTSTKHLTHVQVVRLVISSGPCVTFSVKPACKQRKRSSRRQQAGVRPTPLRTQHRGQHDVTPPGSPTFKRFHLPGYPHHKQRGTAVDSPSQLPFDVMHLDCMPPPPYTPEVPSRHRVLARGEEEHGGREGQEPQGTSHQQEPQDTNYQQEELHDNPYPQEPQATAHQQEPEDTDYQQGPHDSKYPQEPQEIPQQQEPQDTPYQQVPQGTAYQQVPQGTAYQQEPQGTTHLQEPQDTNYHQQPQDTNYQQGPRDVMYPQRILQQKQPQDSPHQREPQRTPYQQEPQEIHCREVAMEIIDDGQSSNAPCFLSDPIRDGKEGSLDENMANVFQDGSVMEQDYPPHPVIMPQEENTSSVEKEALISDTINEMSAAGLTPALGNTCSTSPSSTSQSQSPAPGNGRGSFLSQIRQFNKSKLKKLAICPERNTSDQLQSNHTPDELQWTEVRKDNCIQGNGAQESVDATDLLSALNRVMQNRARVLHDTLNSTDEGDTSDDDDEWEL